MQPECRDYSKRRVNEEFKLNSNLANKSINNRTMDNPNYSLIKTYKYSCIILILINHLSAVNSSKSDVKIHFNTDNNDDYLENDISSNDSQLNIVNNFKPINISYYVNNFNNNTIENETDDYKQSHIFNTGNGLWDNLLNQCYKKPSLSCIQKNVYTYLDDAVGFSGNVNFTSGILFKKNNVDYRKYSRIANTHFSEDLHDENGADSEVNSGRASDDSTENESESETPLEEVTDALYSKSVDFLMSHDLEVALPETMFDGATLKLSPRALTTTGALVHVDLQPRKPDPAVGEGRIFFKKIKKYFKKKLLMAALAIILVIKLIKLKVFFILPLIMGAGAAKKLFLKLVLFIFPALSHIFKLCSWYHQNYHTPKYHHHHHLVSHHHHKVPRPHGAHVAYGAHSPPQTAHVYSQGPPSHEYGPDWELSGPGLGSEYLASNINRNAIANFKPQQLDDLNDINAWGLASAPGQNAPADSAGVGSTISNAGASQPDPGSYVPNYTARPVGPPVYAPGNANRIRKPNSISKEANLLQAEKEALLRAAHLAQKAPPSPIRDEVLRAAQAQLAEQARIRVEQKLIEQQQHILAAQDPDTLAADRFYGSLVEKVERIIMPLGARDPGCRERAVCSLYKEPLHHSPYSNLVSNELSRDSNELQQPAGSRVAMRFYRYVQAARDGQDNKDCIRLYAHCNIDFDKK